MNVKYKFKKGAASFYIVALSTLILLIVVTSFATIIISEIERTSNDDLSQSAYDSAMAGVEDAKLAFYNYQKCLTNDHVGGTDLNCGTIVGYIDNFLNQDCDTVGKILGRPVQEGGGVVIEESTTSNNMQQAYTCVKVQNVLKDYRSTLTGSNQIDVVKVKFDGVAAGKISKVKISWYNKGKDNLNEIFKYTNFKDEKVVFPSSTQEVAAKPPTIFVGMVQTALEFNLSDFDMTRGEQTDRGMVYLVPIEKEEWAGKSVEGNYEGVYSGGENKISKEGFLKSNDKTATNVPYGVFCNPDLNSDEEFACSATIDLPKPIGETRNDDTFMFVVGLPYGTPETEFAMEFFCEDMCATEKYLSTTTGDDAMGVTGTETEVIEKATNQASLKNVQIGVDSTGRANDLFRRVEVRLKPGGDSSYLSLLGPLELLGNNSNGGTLLEKNYAVTKEYNF